MSKKEIDELIKNSKEKLTIKEISDKTGIPRSTVQYYLKKIGYEYKRKAWNSGLKKENHASLQKISQKLSKIKTGSKLSEETKKKISESMKGKGGVREAAGRGQAWNYGDDVVNSDYELKIAQLLDEEGILWENKNNIINYIDNDGVTRMISLGFYLPEYDIYMAVRYHINNDMRKRFKMACKQNNIKVLIVDEMLYRRIMYNSIKEILKNYLQNKK